MLFVGVSVLLLPLGELVLVVLLELLHGHLFAARVELLLLLLRLLLAREHACDRLNLGRGDRVGELYFECDEQVSEFVVGFVERHTELFARHHLVRLDGLSFLALDSHQTPVQVHDGEVHSG